MKNKVLLITTLALFTLIAACEKEQVNNDPCDNIIGATFNTSGGKMVGILESKCGVSGCHAPGGIGTPSWTFYPEYDSLEPYFNDMYDAAIGIGFMPPDTMPQLSDNDMDVFECWKEAGFPE